MGSEADLVNAIATIGPISVGIDASQDTFKFYSSGIYNEPLCVNDPDLLDHAVTAVGYGSNADGEYYIVKNQWGTVWGIQGYMLISR